MSASLNRRPQIAVLGASALATALLLVVAPAAHADTGTVAVAEETPSTSAPNDSISISGTIPIVQGAPFEIAIDTDDNTSILYSSFDLCASVGTNCPLPAGNMVISLSFPMPLNPPLPRTDNAEPKLRKSWPGWNDKGR